VNFVDETSVHVDARGVLGVGAVDTEPIEVVHVDVPPENSVLDELSSVTP
jgi:hypothetical protein